MCHKIRRDRNLEAEDSSVVLPRVAGGQCSRGRCCNDRALQDRDPEIFYDAEVDRSRGAARLVVAARWPVAA